MNKRVRPKYHAVVKGKVISEQSEKRFREQLAALKPKEIIFVCKGVRLEPSFETKPIVELTVGGVR